MFRIYLSGLETPSRLIGEYDTEAEALRHARYMAEMSPPFTFNHLLLTLVDDVVDVSRVITEQELFS